MLLLKIRHTHSSCSTSSKQQYAECIYEKSDCSQSNVIDVKCPGLGENIVFMDNCQVLYTEGRGLNPNNDTMDQHTITSSSVVQHKEKNEI